MTFFQTIAVAFSMFSAIPMPQFEWNTRNMRCMLVAFALIGVIVGLLVWAWTALVSWLGWGRLLYAAGLVAIPVLVTGGIHLDGFCDTHDALASHAPMERKLEIMKDSHTGAFAIIAVAVYFLCYFGFATELAPTTGTVLCLGALYVMSRAASGFAVATFPMAKGTGLAHTFSDMSSKRIVAICDGIIAVAAAVFAILLCGIPGIGMVAGVIVALLVYRAMSGKLFGGITGDLAGWFLQIAELLGVVGIVIASVL